MNTNHQPAFTTPLPPSLQHDSDIRLHRLLSSLPAEHPGLKAIFDRHGIAPWEGQAALVKEITRDGSNTIVSILMGQAESTYIDIVKSVAGKLRIECKSIEDEILIERRCLESVLNRYLTTAPDEERTHIMRIIDDTGEEFHIEELSRKLKSGALKLGTLTLLIRQIGARATAQIVKKIVGRIIGRQVAREASKRAAQMAGFAIPLLNIVMIGWTVWDLAGPAYRKTIPTVLEIALLRMEFESERSNDTTA